MGNLIHFYFAYYLIYIFYFMFFHVFFYLFYCIYGGAHNTLRFFVIQRVICGICAALL